MQQNAFAKVVDFLTDKTKRKVWRNVLVSLSAVVVFVTTYALILPAITMESTNPYLEAGSISTTLGNPLSMDVTAVADDEKAETYFYLSVSASNAGLNSKYIFDEYGVTEIIGYGGESVQLHQTADETGNAHYWFSLQQGETTSFALEFANGIGAATLTTWTEEVPVTQPEAEEAEATPEPTPEAATQPTEGEQEDLTEGNEVAQPESEDDTEPETTPELTPEPVQTTTVTKQTVSFANGDATASGYINVKAGRGASVEQACDAADQNTLDPLNLAWEEDEPDSLDQNAATSSSEGDSENTNNNPEDESSSNANDEDDSTPTFSVGPMAMELVNSGKTGNLNWKVETDNETGETVLTISGTGTMPNYAATGMPWSSYRPTIDKVVVETGVTSIGVHAFYDCTALKEVSLPSGITTIDNYAFYDCTALKEVSIPSNVTTIGNATFYNCTSLTSATLSANLASIPTKMFWGCTSLEAIDIPNSVTSIGDSAFYGCSALQEIHMPDTVTALGGSAFSNCTNLENLTLSAGLTSIPSNAFRTCMKLEEITIPDGVTSIGAFAFYECTKLVNVNFPDALQSIGIHAFTDCRKLEKVVLPDGTLSVGERAFQSCKALTEAILPDSVTYIGVAAFRGCDALTTVNIPRGVTTINSATFQGCNLGEVTIPSQIVAINENGFSRSNITKLNYEEGSQLEYIGKSAFSANGFAQAFIPASVKTIDDYAFHYFYGALTSIVFEEGSQLESIGMRAFGDYNGLTNASITTMSPIPASVKYIGNRAFAQLNRVEDFTFVQPNRLETIDDYAFYGILYAENLYIGEHVTSIGFSAFAEWHTLSNLYYDAKDASYIEPFGSTVQSFDLAIGKNVDTLPASFTEFASRADTVHFEGPNQITLATSETGKDILFAHFDAPLSGLGGTIWVDEQGVVYEYDAATGTATLVYCQPGIEAMVVPTSITPEPGVICTVTSIDSNALNLASDLASIVFDDPTGITHLASYALANCPTLMSVNGETTVDGAAALFTNAQTSVNETTFINTGLTQSGTTGVDLVGKEEIRMPTPGSSTSTQVFLIKPDQIPSDAWTQSGDGGHYQLLTGQSMTTMISAGSVEEAGTHTYRVYFELVGNNSSISVSPGTGLRLGDQIVDCYATDDPNVLYIEFEPEPGSTASFSVQTNCISPTSSGGYQRVWAEILDENGTVYTGGDVPSQDGNLVTQWATVPTTYDLTKKAASTAAPAFYITGDGEGGGVLASAIAWNIALTRNSEDYGTLGNDFVRYVDYTDTLTLPDGMYWTQEVKDAIRNKTLKYDLRTSASASTCEVYLEDAILLKLQMARSGAAAMLSSVNIEWDDEADRAVVHWRTRRQSVGQEMPNQTTQFTIYPVAFSLDLDEFTALDTIGNNVKAECLYTYSEKYAKTASVTTSLRTYNTAIGMTKAISRRDNSYQGGYLGDSLDYEIVMTNKGTMPFTRAGVEGATYLVEDTLPNGTNGASIEDQTGAMYITAQNMQRMFEEEYGDNLVVTIERADLAPWEAVTAIDGVSTAYKNASNTHPEYFGADYKTNQTLHINKNANGSFSVQVEGGGTYTAASVAQALQDAGYAVTMKAQYICRWMMAEEGDDLVVYGGASYTFNVYANSKDTYRTLQEDNPTCHPVETNIISNAVNTVSLRCQGDEINTQLASSAVAVTIRNREAYLEKSATIDGVRTTDFTNLSTGVVIEYGLYFRHTGLGLTENLPLVDDMYGSQYLLVPVAQNPALSDLETVEDDGVLYYILAQGKYTNVVVGTTQDGVDCVAAEITVAPASATENEGKAPGDYGYTYSGIHTQIKWYLDKLQQKTYETTVSYKAVVDVEIKAPGGGYTINNWVWLNDRKDSRLYSAFGSGGAVVKFDKEIVTDKGASYASDLINANDYSPVGNGESVIYRLSLKKSGDNSISLTGTEFFDMLPLTGNVFAWEKGTNVQFLGYQSDGQAGAVTATNLENWSIQHIEDADGAAATATGQYKIVWDDDTTIVYAGDGTVTLYLYFQLTYPAGEEGDDQSDWAQYTNVMGSQILTNTFSVQGYMQSVNHQLKIEGEVLLQKGVFGTYATGSSLMSYDDRLYYNNQTQVGGWAGRHMRWIRYYVVLANDSNARLYINDLYDQLPKGFLFAHAVNDGKLASTGTSTSTTALGGSNWPNSSPLVDVGGTSGITSYRSATITATSTTGQVVFNIGAGTGEYAVRYDEEREQYYLEKGEAIVFGYVCRIPEYQNTEDVAVNKIMMPYTDTTEFGVKAASNASLNVTGSQSILHTDQNDGGCTVRTDAYVEETYGVNSEAGDGKWLVSDVTVRRGTIKPGITKYIEGYMTQGSSVLQPYSASIHPSSTVQWRIRVQNNGTGNMQDYTITDVLPAPFIYTGEIRYTTYADPGTDQGIQTIYTIGERGIGDTSVKITGYNVTVTVPITAHDEEEQWVELPYTSSNVPSVSISKDAKGNEVLKMRFPQLAYSLYEHGGCADLRLQSTAEQGSAQVNKVFFNNAYITPNEQPFTEIECGSIVYDENGKPESVRAIASVTTAASYATSSVKGVTELDSSGSATENSTSSTNLAQNYILLDKSSNRFDYTLTVNNDASNPLESLVLIDNLPEVGDSYAFGEETFRESEFKVKFASNPNVRVQITLKGETTPIVLNADQYVVGYQESVIYTPADWDGSSSWGSNANGARSIRVVLRSNEIFEIAAGAKIEVIFTAEIEGEALPGQTAWNNFGYHYTVAGVELEAMPLVVGVKIRQQPTLEKQLINRVGGTAVAEKDTDFDFLVYTGAALAEPFETKAQLVAALKADGRTYEEFTVTVKAGESSSGKQYLSQEDFWVNGEKYTIVELPHADYTMDKLAGTGENAHTFTYTADKAISIACVNREKVSNWALEVTKLDSADGETTLQNAVFALYSKDAADAMGSIEYALLNGKFGVTPETTLEFDEKTWYLTKVEKTDADGQIHWTGLLQEEYYLLEAKAPMGYQLPEEPGQLVSIFEVDETLTNRQAVENTSMFALPESGGRGTLLYTVAGMMLVSLAILLYKKSSFGKGGRRNNRPE